MDVQHAEGSQQPSSDVPATGTNFSQLTLEQTLKVVALVRKVYDVKSDALGLIGTLIRESPENAKQLAELLEVPFTYGSLVKALVDRNVMDVLLLAYEVGLY